MTRCLCPLTLAMTIGVLVGCGQTPGTATPGDTARTGDVSKQGGTRDSDPKKDGSRTPEGDSKRNGGDAPKSDSKKVGATDDKKPAADVTITAAQLMKDYYADKTAAQKYVGKTLEITGTVDEVYSGFSGELILNLQGYAPDPIRQLTRVHCQLQLKEEARALNLSNKQTVTIRARLTVLNDTFSASLKDGQLITVGPNPALVVTAAQMTKDYAADTAAAIKKYRLQPMLLEGVVADIERRGRVFIFELVGHDEKAAKPIRVEVDFHGLISEKMADKLAAVKKGETVQVRGVAQIYEFETRNRIVVSLANLVKRRE